MKKRKALASPIGGKIDATLRAARSRRTFKWACACGWTLKAKTEQQLKSNVLGHYRIAHRWSEFDSASYDEALAKKRAAKA